MAFLVLGGPEGIQGALHDLLGPALGRKLDGNAPEHEELLDLAAVILPGIVAISWMVMTLTNGSLAQGVLARFGASWRPSPDLAALALPMWIPILLAFAAGATILGGTSRLLGINVMIVLAVPFCLAGLGGAAHPGAPLFAADDPARDLLCACRSVRMAAAVDHPLGVARFVARIAAAPRPTLSLMENIDG